MLIRRLCWRLCRKFRSELGKSFGSRLVHARQAAALEDAARRVCRLARKLLFILQLRRVDDNLRGDVLNNRSRLKNSLAPGVVRSGAGAADHFDSARRKPAWPAQKLLLPLLRDLTVHLGACS